ncbi:uncharacterized protein PAC_15944 [Phialocephala subalpina]|uniref:2EXR domain-containing protein n=1 Tax=Phialocephala subalpina TaxID=576137 RepID=A0A1L7XLZ9_9HELO|nr:uncharacterized protein PAC_15944 [Phialocephala subalpina]
MDTTQQALSDHHWMISRSDPRRLAASVPRFSAMRVAGVEVWNKPTHQASDAETKRHQSPPVSTSLQQSPKISKSLPAVSTDRRVSIERLFSNLRPASRVTSLHLGRLVHPGANGLHTLDGMAQDSCILDIESSFVVPQHPTSDKTCHRQPRISQPPSDTALESKGQEALGASNPSSVSSTTQSVSQHFHHAFPHLPIEIRLMIWKYASFTTRNVDVTGKLFWTDPGHFIANVFRDASLTPSPPVLQVNQESRSEALKWYSLEFGRELRTVIQSITPSQRSS